MRYMNWDVLIFPETGETKTPLQEFATACTVVQDPGKALIMVASVDGIDVHQHSTIPLSPS